MTKYKEIKSLRSNSWKNDAKRADKRISFCTICNLCWESHTRKTWMSRGARKNVLYLEDFPRYGKKKETCPNCL
tara:strand:- start:22586 stop:22807 length:222 start_codon:yes stop_codon:yes gene_type:complete